MKVVQTARLALRWFTLEDAEFIFRLVNEPSWITHIGDRGIRNLTDARCYLEEGPLAMYAKYGFGLFCVERIDDGTRVGMCGILKRDSLAYPDLGYAILPEFWRNGYAFEAASACLKVGKERFGITRMLATTSPDNWISVRLLEKLGFRYKLNLPAVLGASELKLFCLEV